MEEINAEEIGREISETRICFLSVSWLIKYHSLGGKNRDDQEGRMVIYNHGTKSAPVPDDGNKTWETCRLWWTREQPRGRQGLALKMSNS